MVACISLLLSAGERNYVALQGEMLAAVWAIKSFHVYLHGVPFTLITYHQPLTWLMAKQDLTGMHAPESPAPNPISFMLAHNTSSQVSFQMAFIDTLPPKAATNHLHLEAITVPSEHDDPLPMPPMK